MRIEVNCATSKVIEATPEEREFLRNYMTFQDPQARFSNGNPVVELVNPIDDTFPSGFAGKVRKAGEARLLPSGKPSPITVELVDVRTRPPPRQAVDLSWLRDYQRQAVETALTKARGIVQMPTGAGKCLGLGTLVLKYDGTSVPVETLQQGDLVMGPDSKPRRILSTIRGRGPLYQIMPLRGQPWVCNDVHVLTLANTSTGQLVDIPLDEYLQKSKYWKHMHKQVGTGVDFAPQSKPLPIDPYFLGVWYGDGTKLLNGVQVTKPDPEIRDLMEATANEWGLHVTVDTSKERCPAYRLSNGNQGGKPNPLLTVLRSVVGDGKTFPHEYLTASEENRRAFLAGLLDTDGYLHNNSIEIVQRRKGYADGIMFLARSLGYRAILSEKVVNATTYWRVSLSGEFSTLPMRIARKKAPLRKINKAPTRTGFSCKPLGEGEYAGFMVDGDGRFLLGDFTITHNSVAAAGIVASVPEARWLIVVPQSDLLEQFAKHIRERLGEEPGIIGDGQWHPQRITIATFQTLSRRMTKNRDQRAFSFMRSVQGMIVDEAHQCASGSFSFVCSQAVNAFYRIGISATPLDRTDKKSVFVIAQLGGLIHKTSSAELRARGFLADATVKMVRCVQGSNAPTWPGVYGECVVRSKARNALVAQMAATAAKPALVFVNHVKHGATLLPLIRKAGLQAKLVWGEADTEERRDAIKDLVEGRLDVIVCSNVFAQGVDIPSLKSVINAAGGSSVILTLQRLGRGTRVTESKTTFEAWDVLDDGNRYLAKHGRTRQDTYEREGFKVEVIDQLSGVEGAPDPRKDEHGFVLGSSAQAKWRADQRKEALQALAGVDKLRNPSRCKVLRPHQLSDGECQLCGASVGNLAPECPGYQPEQLSLGGR